MAEETLTSEERREQILARVTSAFAETGFAGARTTDLAKLAGVSQALLYKLFGDKRGLYTAMIERKLSQVEESYLTREPAPDLSDHEHLSEVAFHILSHTRADPAFSRLLLYSELGRSEFSQLFRELHSHRALTRLRDYVQARIEAGAFCQELDPDLAAWSFLGMVWQYALSAYVFEHALAPELDPRPAAESFARMFLGGARR